MKIRWTIRASDSFHKTVDYIEEEWGERSAIKFINTINEFLATLEVYPEIGKMEIQEKGIRGFVISRQTTVLYRIKSETIILLKFFDNRQHPIKRNK